MPPCSARRPLVVPLSRSLLSVANEDTMPYSACMPSATCVLDPASLPPFVDADEGRLMMALKFYELGRLSLGQAAELAGYEKRAFIDALARYDIPVIDYAADDLAGETEW